MHPLDYVLPEMHPLDYVLPFTEDWIMYYLWLGEALAGTCSSQRNNAISLRPSYKIEPLGEVRS
jgi:hypothetical protein